MSSSTSYSQWFNTITDWPPHDWQADLAAEPICRNRLIRIPTGLGKTEGVLAAWLFHSVCPVFASDRGTTDDQVLPNLSWPRRLAWCLPMRVLVEQTAERCQKIIDRWGEVAGIAEKDRPRVHLLMGGEDTDRWWLEPERHAILVGTQDMLLSRALNRGYASGRARWQGLKQYM